MGLHFISGPNPLNRDIACYYWLDLNEMSIPEVMEVDILWEGVDNEILTIFRLWLLTGVYLNCESPFVLIEICLKTSTVSAEPF